MSTMDATSQVLLLNEGLKGTGKTEISFWTALRTSLKHSALLLGCALAFDMVVRLGLVVRQHFSTRPGEYYIQLLLLALLTLVGTGDSLLRSNTMFVPPRGMIVSTGFVFVVLMHCVIRTSQIGPIQSSLLMLHGSVLFGSYELLAGWLNQQAPKRVAILGMDRVAGRIGEYLQSRPELHFDVKGYIDRRETPRDTNVPMAGSRLPVLGSLSEFETICRKNFIDEILVTLSSSRDQIDDVIGLGSRYHVAVRIVPDQLQEFAKVAQPSFVGEFPTLAVTQRQESHAAIFLKRCFDVFFSLLGLIALSPLFLLIAVFIRLDSRGAVFYRSKRVGRKGKTFRCLKFRTMVADAERRKNEVAHLNQRDSILFKMEGDPRITRVGKFLRKYSLDELPQLVNVLLGEMSLVGPRPCLPAEVNRYQVDALRRLEATPGITGLWQVKARRDPSFNTYLAMDLKYIDNWNFWMDLAILASTVRVVLAGTGQ